MKALLLCLLVATPALAQHQDFAAACGPAKTTFTAHESENTVAQADPAPGKATVYFIQDRGELADSQHFTIKIGLDGAWVGAYKNNSVFAISVDPGEHHVCANVQSNFIVGENLALAHFNAQPGQTYYFRTRFIFRLDLDQPDSDQAKYLIDTYPESILKQKK